MKRIGVAGSLLALLLCAAETAAAERRRPLPLIEIVSGSESSVTYRERQPLRVRLETATMLYHAPECPVGRGGKQGVAPASATLQGYRPHSCAATAVPAYVTRTEPRTRDPKRVSLLFLGNSLTYFNQMPRMTEALGSGEARPLYVEAVTRSGADLDHLRNDTEALKKLWQRRWDYVVLQGGGGGVGPLSRPDEFERSLQRLVTEVRKSGATPLLFLVWARDARVAENIEASKAIARRLRLRIVPVGIAWAALEGSGALRRLLWDSVHPNAFGSYLIACAVYS